jgi:hypothetical protein
MPDIWTHLIEADRIRGSLSNRMAKAAIDENRRYYDLGSQGPDFFFYYNFWPWNRDKRGSAGGHTIHHRRCRDFFDRAFGLIKGQKDQAGYDQTLAYMLGMLTHWAVDRNTHAYIHYISGLADKNSPDAKRLRGNHKRVEAAIDTILAKEYWGIDLYQHPANERFNFEKGLPDPVTRVYTAVVPELYPDVWGGGDPVVARKAYADMMKATRTLFDPTGRKKRWWRVVDRMLGSNLVDVFFYKERANMAADYLNDQHREWCHPADQTEVSTASLRDLLDRAVAEGVRLIEITMAYLKDEVTHEEWLGQLGNLSFSTGKDSGAEVELKYCQPILE